MFFQEYSAEKTKHQDEICNTVVYKTLEEMRKGCLVILPNGKVGHGVKNGGATRYREFCLALKFALTLCGDMTSAIAESLSVNMPDYHGKPMSKQAFSSWLTAL
ncbi:hypothetical protein CLOM_g8647 [Closterium sp. NIES-68]|nr:hypothetical protein CLOM_g20889 [Closterium sp. NIES-68]GJP49442.1 hypothetical protein CLOM_g8647 [Closterium sp. NIES-68]GJP68485.1 hypothetical protein CLOP_g25187 [Closterium sp. NIES-67]